MDAFVEMRKFITTNSDIITKQKKKKNLIKKYSLMDKFVIVIA